MRIRFVNKPLEGYGGVNDRHYRDSRNLLKIFTLSHPAGAYVSDFEAIGNLPSPIEQGFDLERAARLGASLAAGFTPGVSTAYDLATLFAKTDPITGDPITLFDRGLIAIGLATPLNGASLRAAARAGKFAVKNADEIVSGISRLTKTDLAQLPDRFEGVKQASRYLREMGMPRSERMKIIRSFDVDAIRLRPVAEREYGIRFFDNISSKERGRYLFETFPASRDNLAVLPEWNEMTHFRQWRIRPGTRVIEGSTAPQRGFPGGQKQKFVLRLEDLLEDDLL